MIKKTRKELEKLKKRNDVLFWITIALLLVLMVSSGLDERKISKLKTQLSECQEQVPVWNSNDCVDVEYWYNNGEGRDFNNINEIMLRDTINCLEGVIE